MNDKVPRATREELYIREKAMGEIFLERIRQLEGEGFSLARDDEYTTGELARAAASYALSGGVDGQRVGAPPYMWPWKCSWWKPTIKRRDLIKAAALILAEIERLDREKLKEDG